MNSQLPACRSSHSSKARSGSLPMPLCASIAVATLTLGISPTASAQSAPADNDAKLSEIIVTAQKKKELLQDVPVPVTALQASDLLEKNELRLQDYFQSIPGFSLTSSGSGDSTLVVRGITTGPATNPTVAVTIDGVPFGSSSILTNASFYVPDLDPSNLQRVELLRGPQGTLYGASGIGGLLNYVTADPSTKALSGWAQVDGNVVHNGVGEGYGVRGSINIPITDTFAMIASGSTRRDPGYIDNILTDQKGINKVEVDGAHLSALFKPSDDFSIKWGVLAQDTHAFGATDEAANGDSLQQSFSYGTGVYSTLVRLYTMNVNAKVLGVDVASITGYGTNTIELLATAPSFYNGLAGALYGPANANAIGSNDAQIKKFTQEIRLSSTIGRVDWLVGGFYTQESGYTDQPFEQANPLTGASLGSIVDFYFPLKFIEMSEFADLTVHFTDQFNIQVGGRESKIRQRYDEDDSGPAINDFFGEGNAPVIFPPNYSHESAFTYLLTPQFKFTPDLMAYMRFASGYRPGGPNAEANAFGLPSQYYSDKTYNYEVGFKGNFLDHRLSIDASVYYIDWKDIQLSLFDENVGLVFAANASSAKSDGIELSVAAKPLSSLTLTGWVAYSLAELTSNVPAEAGAGSKGDPLPLAPKYSAYVAADQEFPLFNAWTGFAAADVAYVGERLGTFGTTRQVFPSYSKLDLRTGGRRDGWTLTAYLNNATDRRGTLSGDPTVPGAAVTFIQPRTAGISVGKSF
jgi:iron complex outermembrane recepter protein